MKRAVGVELRSLDTIEYFKTIDDEIRPPVGVIVKTKVGTDIGYVVREVFQLPEEKIDKLNKIIRKVTQEDIEKLKKLEIKEEEARLKVLEKIEYYKLPMKIEKVVYLFDESKLTIYFDVEERIDFKELLRDLIETFNTRIELHQITPREKFKKLKAIGPCGLPLCCYNFLKEFETVSIKMVKEQNLALNPAKISGLCGRLLCCLKYEYGTYQELRKDMPLIESKVKVRGKEGRIVDMNVIKQKVVVEFTDGVKIEVNKDEIELL